MWVAVRAGDHICAFQRWQDHRLEWNSETYTGVQEITLPANRLWMPDVGVMNGKKDTTFDFSTVSQSRLGVTRIGEVTWLHGTVLDVTCPLDVAYFPFDKQVCHLVVTPWHSAANQVRIVPVRYGADVDNSFLPNSNVSEWVIETVRVKRDVYRSGFDVEYQYITISILLKRQPLYFIILVLVPFGMLSGLACLIFTLDDTGDRLSVALSLVLSMTMYVVIVSSNAPRSMRTLPVLGIYLLNQLGLLSVATLVAVSSNKLRSKQQTIEKNTKVKRANGEAASRPDCWSRCKQCSNKENYRLAEDHLPSAPLWTNSTRQWLPRDHQTGWSDPSLQHGCKACNCRHHHHHHRHRQLHSKQHNCLNKPNRLAERKQQTASCQRGNHSTQITSAVANSFVMGAGPLFPTDTVYPPSGLLMPSSTAYGLRSLPLQTMHHSFGCHDEVLQTGGITPMSALTHGCRHCRANRSQRQAPLALESDNEPESDWRMEKTGNSFSDSDHKVRYVATKHLPKCKVAKEDEDEKQFIISEKLTNSGNSGCRKTNCHVSSDLELGTANNAPGSHRCGYSSKLNCAVLCQPEGECSRRKPINTLSGQTVDEKTQNSRLKHKAADMWLPDGWWWQPQLHHSRQTYIADLQSSDDDAWWSPCHVTSSHLQNNLNSPTKRLVVGELIDELSADAKRIENDWLSLFAKLVYYVNCSRYLRALQQNRNLPTYLDDSGMVFYLLLSLVNAVVCLVVLPGLYSDQAARNIIDNI